MNNPAAPYYQRVPPRIAGKVYIYALLDPRDGSVRYVGQTSHPSGRLSEHRNAANKGRNPRLISWTGELRALGLAPTWYTLEIVAADAWEEPEIRAIAEHRARGCDLVNATDGGSGNHGFVPRPESIAQWRATLKQNSERRARHRPTVAPRAPQEASAADVRQEIWQLRLERDLLTVERDAWRARALAAESSR